MRLAIIGWGAMARHAARFLQDSPVDIVAVGVRDLALPRADLPPGAVLITEPSQLAATRPDLVAEAAGRASVGPWCMAALTMGVDVVVSSVSALADPDLLELLRSTAMTHHSQVHIPPGALGGIDVLRAAQFAGIDSVEHRIVKPPHAWIGTSAESLCALGGLIEPTEFFTGDAAATATAFPNNANVAMTTALAGIGPSQTRITLVADPNIATNRHEVRAHGAFGTLEVIVNNNPLPDNPKTSTLAALSLARVILNRVNPIVI